MQRMQNIEDNVEQTRREKEKESKLKQEIRRLREEDKQRLMEQKKRQEQNKKMIILMKEKEHEDSVRMHKMQREILIQTKVEQYKQLNHEKR